MINLTLEQMQKQHLDDVARLEQVCFTQPWSYKSLEEELENDTAHLFVALCDDKVAGYISVYVVLESCYVNNIAVFPEYRRQGVGTALLKMAMLTADAMGTDFISLEVRKSNAEAISLYEKLGFEEMGLRKNFYRHPTEDALIMTKLFTR